MRELLEDLLEYMESRADADNEGPNKEMGLQIRIEEALAKMEKINGHQTEAMWEDEAAQLLPAPNTVMWWLCRIADPEIRRKAVDARLVDRYKIGEGELYLGIHEVIDVGFWWRGTVDGEVFWTNFYNSEIPLLPEPDFTEYNELRK